ncbi:nucleobase-ascorbate transporter 7-like isoform X2 [Triticum urartu]|uniref:nucleobase-ascorbate transporter 7-like isoform X2 n=1 Tax=Triticum urartu TaxID=4572 RepID=UPI002043215B|nr:nucleobase-ascorbate transporter 7-like isoform X2 [Triticum urartu]
MGGNSDDKAVVMQIMMFLAGINTLLQSFFGTRLPAVIGGSYTFVLPTISIILAGHYTNEPDTHHMLKRRNSSKSCVEHKVSQGIQTVVLPTGLPYIYRYIHAFFILFLQ